MSARLLPGQIIPGTRYRVLAKVGQGAMGVVYAAEHVDLEKKVAIKLLTGRVARRDDVIERFRNEARAASKVGSAYICDVTDFGSLADGRLFFVMEYLEGRSLRAVLDTEGQLGPERAIPILRQVAKALGAAHEKGIIHLDVKPDNVMLVQRGRREVVKVVDFGVAGLLNEQQPPSGDEGTAVNGTPAYMAPERALGHGFDHRSDIYSMGVMAYEILTGSVPFEADDVLGTLRMHVREAHEPMRQRSPERKVPEPLEELVDRLLTKNPGDRPQSMADVEALLCEAQIAARLTTTWDDLELPAVEESWRAKIAARMPSPWGRRARVLTLAAGTVAVVAASAAVYFGVFSKNTVLVPVEVTRTEEPAEVAEHLVLASRAARAQHYVTPAQGSALQHIERAEQEASKLGRNSPGARTLRESFANALMIVGNHLLEASLRDLAITKFKEALLFNASDAELQRKAELTPGERAEFSRHARRSPAERTAASAARPSSEDDQAKSLAASLYVAAKKGNLSEARVLARNLAALDRQGVHAARLADAVRPIARSAWKDGRADEARAAYRLVSELDPGDPEARERGTASVSLASALPIEASGLAARNGGAPAPATRPLAASTAAQARGAERVDLRWNEPAGDAAAARAASELGVAAMRKGRLDDADAAFRKAVRADPSSAVGIGGLAEVAFERARYTEALDYARRAARMSPRTVKYHVIMGDALFKLLRYDAAQSAYDRARTLAPQDPGVQHRMRRVKERLGER